MSTWTKVKATGMVAAAVIAAAACSRAEASTSRTAAAPPRVVTVVARDFAFQAPDEIPAGLVTFQLQNRGTTLHHMAIVRFDAGKTMQDYFTAMQAAMQGNGPPPAWAHDVGGPNAPDPGGDSNATLMLEPGNYAILCFVDIPDHMPHVMRGMARPLRVTPATVPATAPALAGDITLSLSDYAFGLSKPVTAGQHTLRVTNAATQSHEVELVRLAPGKTVADLFAWTDHPQGPPPGNALGGVSGMEQGVAETFTYDFTPGHYAFICFYPDAKDGKPHFMHGMVQEFDVP